MPDVIVNKNGVFIDTHVRYRTISDNLSKQEYKFLLTTTLTISGPKKLLCVAMQAKTYEKSKGVFDTDWEIIDLRK